MRIDSRENIGSANDISPWNSYPLRSDWSPAFQFGQSEWECEVFIVQHIRYSIKPGKLDAYLPILAELEESSRKVPGVLSFQHYHDRQDANVIFLEARFKSKETAQQVFESQARAKYLSAAADMWAGMTQFSWYTVTEERDILAEM